MKQSNPLNIQDSRYLSSVARGISVIECLSGAIGPQSLTEISKHTGLPIPSVQRLISTLIEAGYVTKSKEGKRYRLTLQTLDLLYFFLSRNTFAKSAWPYLVRLRETLQLDVALSLPVSESMIFLHRLAGYRGHFDSSLPGKMLPMQYCASGRCFLAAQPSDFVDQVISAAPAIPLTEHALTTPQALKTAIRLCGEHGHGQVIQEIDLGVVEIACPIYKASKVVAGVSVQAPLSAMSAETFVQNALVNLGQTAKVLSS